MPIVPEWDKGRIKNTEPELPDSGTKNWIKIENASIHNLKSISVAFPKGSITSIMGPSGSGKSSLAVDTLLKEGQDRICVLSGIKLPESSDSIEVKSSIKQTKITNLPPTFGLTEKIIPSSTETIASTLGIDRLIGEYIYKSPYKKCSFCGQVIDSENKNKIASTAQQFIEQNFAEADFVEINAIAWGTEQELIDIISTWQRLGFESAKLSSDSLILDKTRNSTTPIKGTLIIKIDKLLTQSLDLERLNHSINLSLQNDSYGCQIVINSSTGTGQKSLVLSEQGFCSICNIPAFKSKSEHFLLKLENKNSEYEWRGWRIYGKENLQNIWQNSFIDPSRSCSFQELVFQEIALIRCDNLPEQVNQRISLLLSLGLGHLSLSRSLHSLSHGEYQRIRLARMALLHLANATIICVEPTTGLHHSDLDVLITILKNLKERGNTVVLTEHNRTIINNSDYLIEMGPSAGLSGGNIIKANWRLQLEPLKNPILPKYESVEHQELLPLIKITNARLNNLKIPQLVIPKEKLISVSGVSGSGKSSLVIKTLAPLIKHYQDNNNINKEILSSYAVSNFEVTSPVKGAIVAWELSKKRNALSTVATYTELNDLILGVFASTEMARILGFSKNDFALKNMNSKSNKLKVRYKGLNILEFMKLTISEAIPYIDFNPKAKNIITNLTRFHLDHLVLGQHFETLSRGERQLLNLAVKLKRDHTNMIYLLDEPTRGLSESDISKLLLVFRDQVRKGNTIVAVEHSPLFILSSDYIIDLGPGAGKLGGKVVFCDTPTNLLKNSETPTAIAAKKYLKVV